jgi:hypothetical protein
MKTVGSLCDIVRREEKLLTLSGYSEQDILELENQSGESF